MSKNFKWIMIDAGETTGAVTFIAEIPGGCLFRIDTYEYDQNEVIPPSHRPSQVPKSVSLIFAPHPMVEK